MNNDSEKTDKTWKKIIHYVGYLISIPVAILISPIVISIVLVLALDWVLAWGWLLALAWAWALVWPLALAMAWIWLWALTLALAWILDWALAWGWLWALVWNPELLESLYKFIRDKQIIENAEIITAITICLILFLLRKKDIRKSLLKIITKISEAFQGRLLPWQRTLKEIFNESLKLSAYPVHFAIRLITPLAILAAVFIPLLLILILIAGAWDIDISKLIEQFIEDKQVFTIITMLASVGLFSFLFQKFIEIISKSLSNIKKKTIKIVKVFWNTGLPRIEIRKSLLETCCSVAQAWPFMRKTVAECINLILSVLILCIIAFFGYISTQKVTREVKEIVNKEVPPEFIKTPVRDTSLISRGWRDSVTAKLDSIEKDIERLLLRPSTSYRFNKGTLFSLIYEEGDLETKKGICPEGSNLEWLKLFKTTILDSPKDGRIKMNVQGFASVAPVPVNGIINDRQSDTLNCEIANQRAEALIYFLTTEPYDSTKCRSALDNHGRWGREDGKPYTRGTPDTLVWKDSGFTVTYDDSQRVQWEGSNLTVTYKPWESYDEMAENKPLQNPPKNLQNPQEEEDRQLDREFLNRSVRITIK